MKYHLIPPAMKLLATCFALCCAAQAATFTVTNTNPTGPGSLHQTVADAAASDTINFDASLSGQSIQLSDTLVLNKILTIDASALGAGIKFLGTGRVVEVTAGRTVVLRNLELRNGWSNQGGGIYNAGTLTLDSCTIANNGDGNAFGGGPTAEGGGIYNAGTLTLNQCMLTGNIANTGAAIFNQSFASLAVNHSTITGNEGVIGTGGIRNAGTLILNNTGLSGNTSGGPSDPNLSNTGALTVFVTTAADSGTGSLRERLSTYPSAQAILFAPGLAGQTITLTSGEIPLNTTRAIDASAVAGGLTISGNNAGRIFNIGASGNVTLMGLKLTNGRATDGHGGAIFNEGQLTVDRCTVVGSTATLDGGGIYNGGVLTVNRCTVASNTTSLDGGGIFSPTGSQFTLLSSTIHGNSARNGGGIYCTGATLVATSCTFTANTADVGGACYLTGGGPASLLKHLTLTNNRVNNPSGGGGIFLDQQDVSLQNCIVAGNTAPYLTKPDGDITRLSGSITPTGMNLIGNLSVYGLVAGPSVITGAPLLAPLGNYGGPTPTMPPLSGSPATDAASVLSPAFTTDQRGFPIVGKPDIGAVEFGKRVTTLIDELDAPGTPGAGISLREAVRDTPSGSSIDFLPAFSGQTITLTRGSEIYGELQLKVLTIDASGLPAGITIDGGTGTNRIFFVPSETTLTLKRLILTGGNGVGAPLVGRGGAIANEGTLTLTECTLSSNTATGIGGAIYNTGYGTLALTQCALDFNSAVIGGGAIASEGGTVALMQCTLFRNDAGPGLFPASGSVGGAIYCVGPMTLTHCTLSVNRSSADGGAIFCAAPLTLTNSIIAGNLANAQGPNIIINQLGVITTSGVNVIDHLAGSGLTAGPSVIVADPNIASFFNSGGPTKTMPPKSGSPAIDASVGSTFTTDQRGFPVFGTPDIGATEGATVVTTVADELDPSGTVGTGISLREADRDTIWGGTIGFAPALSGQTIVLQSDIALSTSVEIDASNLPGGVILSGGDQYRIFTVAGSNTKCRLNNLTLTNGRGMGLVNNINYQGGAIFQYGGELTLTQCTLHNNYALVSGGAIYNRTGKLTLSQCTLSYNSTENSGGAIHLDAEGELTLIHSTLAGNGSLRRGGAIFNFGGSGLTLSNSIVAGNTAPGGPDIVSGPPSPTGKNLIGNLADSGLSANDPAVITGAPLLAPLGNYGGSTQTMALLPGSPARNAAGVLSPASTSDQRGFAIVGTPDIGAYEAGTFHNFAIWALESAGGTLAFGNDDEKDGASNGLEYATRRNPSVSDTPLSPTLAPAVPSGHTFQFRYQKNAQDLRYIVQRSSDLGIANGWAEVYRYNSSTGVISISMNGPTGVQDPTNQLITLTDLATGPRFFWRLVIEQVP
jgi:predicted outer membrane repeat protein